MIAAMAARTTNVRFIGRRADRAVLRPAPPRRGPRRARPPQPRPGRPHRRRRLRARGVRDVRRAHEGAGRAGHRGRHHAEGGVHRRAVRVPGPHRARDAGALPARRPRASRLGGSSEAAARRAARIADGFLPSIPEVWEFYRDEMQRLGQPDPGPCPIGENRTVALAEDAERGLGARWPRTSSTRPTPTARGRPRTTSARRTASSTASTRCGRPAPTRAHARPVRRRAAGGAVPVRDVPPDVRRHPARPGVVEPAPLRARGDAGVRMSGWRPAGAGKLPACSGGCASWRSA